MQENYAPWGIRVEDFPKEGSLNDQLSFLIGFAILAPSGHNTQPWNFSIEGNSISIRANNERSLAASDPTGRQLSISIGCALENLLIAADFYGFDARTSYFPNQSDPNLFASVILNRTLPIKSNTDHLIFSIPKRRTNRRKYENKLPPAEFISKISALSNSDFEVLLVTDEEKRNKLADVANQAQIDAMDSDIFREELSEYVKSSFTKEKTGMPGFTLEMPAPLSLIASRVIKKVNVARKTKKKDDALLKKHTPAFLIISTARDDKLGWAKAGQLFERAWLIAESMGLSFAPLAAGVQIKDHYKSVKNITGLSLTPRVFSRVGFCEKTSRHSPRLGVKEVAYKK